MREDSRGRKSRCIVLSGTELGHILNVRSESTHRLLEVGVR
jgi:hypothetical protein